MKKAKGTRSKKLKTRQDKGTRLKKLKGQD